jgi:ATP adenylyltransferase
MTYLDLLDFLLNKMRLSHIYQPVMIKALLSNNGELKDKDIAAELLKYDISQIEYYQNIANNMHYKACHFEQ